MGGLSMDVGYDVSPGSRAALLRAAEMCPSQRDLGNSLHMDTMGFVSADPVGPALRLADLADGEGGEEKTSAERRRGPNGQFLADGEGGGVGCPTRTLFGSTGDRQDASPQPRGQVGGLRVHLSCVGSLFGRLFCGKRGVKLRSLS